MRVSRASPTVSDQYVASVTGMNVPVSSDRASWRSRSGMRWIRPVILNGGIEISAISGTFGVRRSGRGSIVVSETANRTDARLTWAKSRPDGDVVGAVLVDRRRRDHEERFVSLVEDVGESALPGPDRAAHDEGVCVQREGNLRRLAAHQRVEHAPSIRRARGGSSPAGTTSWRRRSPGARRRAGGPRTEREPSRAYRSRRPACPGGVTRSAGTAARSPIGGGSSGR